tara:strand:- start:39 stop:302 length:264 start_codon:yes stop_codon:yes gene_type:complete
MVLTEIDGIPLYSSRQEALAYAAQNGMSGYHTHEYNGQIGYMGGNTHGEATSTSGPTVLDPDENVDIPEEVSNNPFNNNSNQTYTGY